MKKTTLMLGITALIFTACSDPYNYDSDDFEYTPPPPPPERTVRLEVTSSNNVSDHIIYFDQFGSMISITDVALPWSVSWSETISPSDYFSVSAHLGSDGGSITATITIDDGWVNRTATGSGVFGSVNVNYRPPR